MTNGHSPSSTVNGSDKHSYPPKHVAIIMDGNGRWAEQRHLPRYEGHRAGTKNIRQIVEACAANRIPLMTVYAFSTENWSRPDTEVRALLNLLAEVVDEQAAELHKQGVRLLHLGRLDRLAPELQRAIKRALDLTKDNKGLTLSVAFDYGGRAELLDAMRGMLADHVPPERLDEELFRQYLYTNSLPDPDLIIRTGGEMRLSNFLLWQSAYSEYYSTPVLWPDFSKEELARALSTFQQRRRKFGGVVNPATGQLEPDVR